MASKLMQPPITSSHLLSKLSLPTPRPTYTRFKHYPSTYVAFHHCHKVATTATSEEQSSALLEEDDSDTDTTVLTKEKIYQALEGMNGGVFGVTSAKRKEIEDLVMELEAHNPTPHPTTSLDKVSGCWKLIYSTITILGSKRTKLGLRDFITLGDFLQIIDVAESKAVNIIKFNARGLNLLNGQLTIQAAYSIASPSRVNIKYDSSQITPDQLMILFKKNYELLLSIFNPEGWLEITYVDAQMRIGRDDKGNIFILERATQ